MNAILNSRWLFSWSWLMRITIRTMIYYVQSFPSHEPNWLLNINLIFLLLEIVIDKISGKFDILICVLWQFIQFCGNFWTIFISKRHQVFNINTKQWSQIFIFSQELNKSDLVLLIWFLFVLYSLTFIGLYLKCKNFNMIISNKFVLG